MFRISLMEYETNVDLGTVEMTCIPRVGEFFINDEGIREDWKQKFYIIRAVTYTAGSSVVIHMEKQDVDAMRQREEELKQKLAELTKRGQDNGTEK